MAKKAVERKLDREDVKRYLQQYRIARQKKDILENRKRVLSHELRAPYIGHPLRDTPPVKGGRTDGAVSVLFRIAEVEERIEGQLVDMSKAALNVMDLLDLLPAHSTERTVVEMRHIDCMTWEQIADAMYMARSGVINHYNTALDTLLTYKRAEKLVGDYMTAETHKAACGKGKTDF